MLLGFETSDDAAVWLVAPGVAAVLTVDFFTPVVDDPYEFGRIAAANALSDIFAMGATPHVALNLLALDSNLDRSIAAGILKGGADAVREAGAFVSGGHTIDDDEPKYGLSVFGTVDPERIMRNEGALPGDVLFLTKPLGTGIMSAALKVDSISDEEFRPVANSMMELNAAGGAAMKAAKAHAATDVTGFGLAGHLHEMMQASDAAAVIDFAALPLFDQVWELSCAYCRPNRCFSIMDATEDYLEQGALDDEEFDNRLGVVCDPQTSGGILAAVAPEHAEEFIESFARMAGREPALIGFVEKGPAGRIRFADA